jgi:putative membrane protein
MAERDFFRDDARRRVTEAIREVESKTSAELVVSVRHRSAQYRHADYLLGFACALGALAVLLWAPWSFALWSFPVDLTVAFVLGAIASSQIGPWRRRMTPGMTRAAAVHGAACAAFVKLGVSRTHGRNGILVFVSTSEKEAEVLADVGVDMDAA